jgi:hypothetical protein
MKLAACQGNEGSLGIDVCYGPKSSEHSRICFLSLKRDAGLEVFYSTVGSLSISWLMWGVLLELR